MVHDKLDPETSRDWELYRQTECPTIKKITDFLQIRARAWSNANQTDKKDDKENRKRSYDSNDNNQNNKRQKVNVSSNNTNSKNTQIKGKITQTCKMCTGEHPIYLCSKFKELNVNKRKGKVQEFNLCYNCLSSKHQVRDCKARLCQSCQQKHNSLLCNNNPKNKTINSAQTKQIKPNEKETPNQKKE